MDTEMGRFTPEEVAKQPGRRLVAKGIEGSYYDRRQNTNAVIIGSRIAALRKTFGISQTEFASVLSVEMVRAGLKKRVLSNEAGRQFLGRIERGKSAYISEGRILEVIDQILTKKANETKGTFLKGTFLYEIKGGVLEDIPLAVPRYLLDAQQMLSQFKFKLMRSAEQPFQSIGLAEEFSSLVSSNLKMINMLLRYIPPYADSIRGMLTRDLAYIHLPATNLASLSCIVAPFLDRNQNALLDSSVSILSDSLEDAPGNLFILRRAVGNRPEQAFKAIVDSLDNHSIVTSVSYLKPEESWLTPNWSDYRRSNQMAAINGVRIRRYFICQDETELSSLEEVIREQRETGIEVFGITQDKIAAPPIDMIMVNNDFFILTAYDLGDRKPRDIYLATPLYERFLRGYLSFLDRNVKEF